ncbi:metalloregulator ArsR/SmtB family transcription factor [Pseudonocardia ailaonensis]|uniref:Metalloregulator ArsR/SmtB family transcription factor n=1 Tax=Pseudonocardia ailaonensis TaxID=367279 RepID=A0ABN2MNQ9_9PSEU
MELPIGDADVFRALADPHRRALLDRLHERSGQTLRELTDGSGLTRQALTKHLAVLEAAGLVTTLRRGREKLHHLDAGPIDRLTDRWIGRFARPRVRALTELTTALEDAVTAEFVYTTYVRTTPEKLWDALTDPDFTRRYWGVAFTTDWTVGAPMTWEENGRAVSDPEQVVLEADRPRRLAYTWHTFSDEWAKAAGVDDETVAELVDEPRSRVSFDISPEGDAIKLTVVHSADRQDSTVVGMVSQGWPRILADLKTLLETGDL